MIFEVGKYYKHTTSKYNVWTYTTFFCSVGNSESATQNWTETTEDDLMTNLPKRGEHQIQQSYKYIFLSSW